MQTMQGSFWVGCVVGAWHIAFVSGFSSSLTPVCTTAGRSTRPVEMNGCNLERHAIWNIREPRWTCPPPAYRGLQCQSHGGVIHGCSFKRSKDVASRIPAIDAAATNTDGSGEEQLRVPDDAATVTLTTEGLKTKANMNFGRKAFHALSGVGLACAYEFLMTRAQATLFFGLSFLVLAAVEVLRLRFAHSRISQFLFRRFRSIARDYETTQLSGMVYYMAGIFLSIASFPKTVGVLAVLYLALGDPFASMIGIKYGKRGPRFANGKSLIGSVAGFAICSLITAIYTAPSLGLTSSLVAVSFLGGLAAAIPETVCGRMRDGKGGPIDVDDNLAVPLGSGLLLLAALSSFFPTVLA